MAEQDKPGNQVVWVGMLVFALGFAGLGLWGIATGQLAWGAGSVLFGVVWGIAAFRARRAAKQEGDTRTRH